MFSLIFRTVPWWCSDALHRIASWMYHPMAATTWHCRSRNSTRHISMRSEYISTFVSRSSVSLHSTGWCRWKFHPTSSTSLFFPKINFIDLLYSPSFVWKFNTLTPLCVVIAKLPCVADGFIASEFIISLWGPIAQPRTHTHARAERKMKSKFTHGWHLWHEKLMDVAGNDERWAFRWSENFISFSHDNFSGFVTQKTVFSFNLWPDWLRS